MITFNLFYSPRTEYDHSHGTGFKPLWRLLANVLVLGVLILAVLVAADLSRWRAVFQDPGVDMTVNTSTIKPGEDITLTLWTKGFVHVGLDDGYTIERYVEGNWQPLDNGGWVSRGFTMKAADTFHQEILTPRLRGRYRISKEVSITRYGKTDGVKVILFAEFAVE